MSSQPIFSILLAANPSRYTVISGQPSLVSGVTYKVTVIAPRSVSLGERMSLFVQKDGVVLAEAPLAESVTDPHGTVEGEMCIPAETYEELFVRPEDSSIPPSVQAEIKVSDSTAVWLDSTVMVSAPRVTPDQVPTLSWDQALLWALKFTDIKQVKEWLKGNYKRPDGKTPSDLGYGSLIHTQMEGSFMLVEKTEAEMSLSKNFAPLGSPFPIKGYAKVTATNGDGGVAVHGRDVYDNGWATFYNLDGIVVRADGEEHVFTFSPGASTSIVTTSQLSAALDGVSADGVDNERLLSRLAEVERRLAELTTLQTYKSGTGISINNGVISIDPNITKAFEGIDPDQINTVGDITKVARATATAF